MKRKSYWKGNFTFWGIKQKVFSNIWGIKRTIRKPPHVLPKHAMKNPLTLDHFFHQNMSNAASTVGASLHGEFEEMGSFRLAAAKYSLMHGIPYKIETSKPDEYKAVCPLARGSSPDEQRRICSFQISAYK
jgi:hypothetical protein